MLRGLIAQRLVFELLPTEQELELGYLLRKTLLLPSPYIQRTYRYVRTSLAQQSRLSGVVLKGSGGYEREAK